MKYIFLVVFILISSFDIIAQQYDNNMVFGLHFGATSPDNEEGVLLNFSNYPPASSVMNQSLLNIRSCGFSMSDECGEMIFYSNGLSIVDSTNNIMSNGTNLNAGSLGVDISLGYFDALGMTSVPSPNIDNSYYLFHRSSMIGDSITIMYPEILCTKIDMSQNDGKGIVVEKNIPIIQGTKLVQLSVVRHGNGKDWWLLSGESYDNRYYKILLNENGFSLPFIQQIGFKYPYDGVGSFSDIDIDSEKLFTPNGEKYIDYDARNGVRIMDFDRCTGELSNYEWIVFDEFIGNGAGASVSPNSRFLYVTGQQIVLQYDLEAEDIENSVDTVGILNRMYLNGIPQFTYTQLAADEKIYIVTGGGTETLHIINNPNEKGAACEFLAHGLVLPNDNRYVLPRYPNYRLYDLPDSPCDTLGINGPAEFDCED